MKGIANVKIMINPSIIIKEGPRVYLVHEKYIQNKRERAAVGPHTLALSCSLLLIIPPSSSCHSPSPRNHWIPPPLPFRVSLVVVVVCTLLRLIVVSIVVVVVSSSPPFPSSCCFLLLLLLFVSLPSTPSPYRALYALRPAAHTASFASSCALTLRPVVQVYGASESPMPRHLAASKPSGCRRIRLGVVEPTWQSSNVSLYRRKLLTVSLVHGMVVVVVAERVVLCGFKCREWRGQGWRDGGTPA